MNQKIKIKSLLSLLVISSLCCFSSSVIAADNVGENKTPGVVACENASDAYNITTQKEIEALCLPEIKKGSIDAKISLATYYLNNKMEDKYKVAVQYIEEGAKNNNQRAIKSLIRFYAEGIYYEKDVNKALELAYKALENNVPEMHSLISFIMLNNLNTDNSEGLDERINELVNETNLAVATEKTSLAYTVLGKLYENGINYPEDKSLAYYNFKKALELAPKEALLLNILFEYSVNGEGTSVNLNNAYEYAQSSADLNDPTGILNLAKFYINGVVVEHSSEKYLELLEKAASLNSLDAYGLLIDFYSNGSYTPVDYEKVKKYSEKILEKSPNEAQMLHNLGVINYQGLVKKADKKKGIEYLQKAAELEHATSMRSLGEIYLLGDESVGIKQDTEKGFNLIYKAQGESGADYDLGMMFLEGNLVEKNDFYYCSYMSRAANNGHTQAMYMMGRSLLNGDVPCIPQNVKAAKKYIKAAANAGSQDAENLLNEIEEQEEAAEAAESAE